MNRDCPIFVKLCSGNDLNVALDNDQKTESQLLNELYDLRNDSLYNLIFKPIEKYIKGSTTIYYSPAGKIHRINLQAISNNGKRLMDIYNMFEVSSTAKLLERKKTQNFAKISSAFIIGGVNYDEDIDEMVLASNQNNRNSFNKFTAIRSLYRGSWDALPSTQIEAMEIDSVLKQSGIETSYFNGIQANEESVKNLDGNSPDVIHIATHGFFFENSPFLERNNYLDRLRANSNKTLPMYYSGLLLAGANNVWLGNDLPKGIEDGILTAEEISHLDFTNTKLVVLSACETALGDIDEIEGVYGLQRSFKMAGVETILMSLWKIPDDATKILMVDFYKNLVAGKNKHQSLKDAQLYLRQIENGKYDKPEYWASFIMLDGLN